MLRTEVPGIAQETSDVRRVEGMISTALFVIGTVCGLALSGCALAARFGRLPPNRWVGFIRGTTRRSEAAWRAGHRAAWLPLLLGGLSVVVASLAGLGDQLLSGGRFGLVAIVCVVVFVVSMLLGAMIADRAASHVRDPRA